MKIKTTRKNLKEIYKYIIKVGYCDIYYLLTFNYPVYYCTRLEGWAFDAHIIDYGILVSTGYAPIGNIDSLPYNIENKYNKLAQKALTKFNNRDKQKKIINYLLLKYCKRCIQCKRNTKIKKL